MIKLRLITSSSNNPFFNLAAEETLLSKYRKALPDKEEWLFLCANSSSIILGRNQNPWLECDIQGCRDKNIAIVRRYSGGGTVYHDLGNSNYSWIMRRHDFSRSKAARFVADAMNNSFDTKLAVNERFDIVTNQSLKVSGSAYRLVNEASYHHGTMLRAADLNNIKTLLKPVSEFNLLSSKAIPSVSSPVENILKNTSHKDFVQALVDYSRHQGFETIQSSLDAVIDLKIAQQIENELKKWDWIYGNTPTFEESYKDIKWTVKKGLIESIFVNNETIKVENIPYSKVKIQEIIQLYSNKLY